MTDQIADARPPTRADHAERLRMEAVIHDDLGNEDDAAACLAGAAALEEVATLRAERDKWKQEAADLYHRNEILGTDAHYAEREAVALRARVQHLTEALEKVRDILDEAYGGTDDRAVDALEVAVAALTSPASTEGRNG
jgi:hypothetical protein